MDPLLIGATVVSIVLALLFMLGAGSLEQRRTQSSARVEALQTLVAESSQAARPATAQPAGDLDLELRAPERAEVRPTAPAPGVAATSHKFVATVPEATGARRQQVSFKKQWP